MSTAPALPDEVIDVAFALHGRSLVRQHAQALQDALCRHLPWLASDTVAGIHAIKLVDGTEDSALLSARTRLLIRVERRRLDALCALEGVELDVAGARLRLGAPQARELLPLATLYANRVAASSADEVDFMRVIEQELAQFGIGGHRVCGKHQRLTLATGSLDTFSLMLHALGPEQSLRLQCHGLGPHRLLGCGIFVPHKSAAAV